MLLQVTETTRLALQLAAERVHTNPVRDFEPAKPDVGTRGAGVVDLIIATLFLVGGFSDSWKQLSGWFRQ